MRNPKIKICIALFALVCVALYATYHPLLRGKDAGAAPVSQTAWHAAAGQGAQLDGTAERTYFSASANSLEIAFIAQEPAAPCQENLQITPLFWLAFTLFIFAATLMKEYRRFLPPSQRKLPILALSIGGQSPPHAPCDAFRAHAPAAVWRPSPAF